MISLSHKLGLFAKNSFGWSTKRKIVVFAVDDFGNIRLASKEARERLHQAGVNVNRNRFDRFDCLENAEDLNRLFDMLSSVKDSNNRSAVFTAFSTPANIDFEKVLANKEAFTYQLLPETLRSLPGYEGTWELWQQGMASRVFVPQYHGREHVNVLYLLERLKLNDQQVIANLQNRSWAGLPTSSDSQKTYVSAFGFDKTHELDKIKEIAYSGLDIFEKVFGFRASHFNAPGTPAPAAIEQLLAQGGIKYIDTPWVKKDHIGDGKFKYHFNYTGKENKFGQTYLVRNCVFEPLIDRYSDWASRTVQEIDIAFRLHKPAIISSHRLNFCGGVDAKVRERGLSELGALLRMTLKRWPQVEFLSADELGATIANTK